MVKNEKGGGKGKKVARKHVTKGSDNLRLSCGPMEKYAYVKKLLGNTCDVMCDDGNERRCIIRGKFSGRGKRDNLIEPGKWLLVGMRDWDEEKEKPIISLDKKENIQYCDLLEVYNSIEQDKLKRSYNVFANTKEAHVLIETEENKQDTIDFVDENTLKYRQLIKNEDLCGEQTRKISMKKRELGSNIIVQNFSDVSDDDDSDNTESSSDEEIENKVIINKTNYKNKVEHNDHDDDVNVDDI